MSGNSTGEMLHRLLNLRLDRAFREGGEIRSVSMSQETRNLLDLERVSRSPLVSLMSFDVWEHLKERPDFPVLELYEHRLGLVRVEVDNSLVCGEMELGE